MNTHNQPKYFSELAKYAYYIGTFLYDINILQPPKYSCFIYLLSFFTKTVQRNPGSIKN